jgi:hypothetical protein
VSSLAPRAWLVIVRPRLCSGAGARPLNFTVRPHELPPWPGTNSEFCMSHCSLRRT